MNKWQPIETAPRDNQRLLYLARFNADGELAELDFNGTWEYWEESWELSHINGFCWMSASGIEEPTHWAYQDEPIPTQCQHDNTYIDTSIAGIFPAVLPDSRQFVKKPIVVSAIQWTGDNLKEVFTFTGVHVTWFDWFSSWDEYVEHVKNNDNMLKIFTLEGVMEASLGDWIIRGVQGEYYPCKPDIFTATYEPVNSQLESSSDETGQTAAVNTIVAYRSEQARLMKLKQSDKDSQVFNARGHQQAITAIDFCLHQLNLKE